MYHERAKWNANEDTKIIRNLGVFILPLVVHVHRDLHMNTMPVPLPQEDSCLVFIQEALTNPIIRRGRGIAPVLESIEIWERLNESEVARALDDQVPFLQAGYVRYR